MNQLPPEAQKRMEEFLKKTPMTSMERLLSEVAYLEGFNDPAHGEMLDQLIENFEMRQYAEAKNRDMEMYNRGIGICIALVKSLRARNK